MEQIDITIDSIKQSVLYATAYQKAVCEGKDPAELKNKLLKAYPSPVLKDMLRRLDTMYEEQRKKEAEERQKVTEDFLKNLSRIPFPCYNEERGDEFTAIMAEQMSPYRESKHCQDYMMAPFVPLAKAVYNPTTYGLPFDYSEEEEEEEEEENEQG